MRDELKEFLICLFLGGFGVHKFLDGEIKIGILYLLTGGLFGIGWFIDTLVCLFHLIVTIVRLHKLNSQFD